MPFPSLYPKQSDTLDRYQDLSPHSIGLLFDDDGNIRNTWLFLSNKQEGRQDCIHTLDKAQFF